MVTDTGLRINATDSMTHPTAGNVRRVSGTVIQKLNPKYGATALTTGTRRVFTIDSFVRVLYDFSDQKFKLQVYNGTDWTTIQVLSAAQSFAINDVLFVAARWNAAFGIALNVNANRYFQAVTWTPQSLPATMELGADEMLNLETLLFKSYLSDLQIEAIRLGGIT